MQAPNVSSTGHSHTDCSRGLQEEENQQKEHGVLYDDQEFSKE